MKNFKSEIEKSRVTCTMAITLLVQNYAFAYSNYYWFKKEVTKTILRKAITLEDLFSIQYMKIGKYYCEIYSATANNGNRIDSGPIYGIREGHKIKFFFNNDYSDDTKFKHGFATLTFKKGGSNAYWKVNKYPDGENYIWNDVNLKKGMTIQSDYEVYKKDCPAIVKKLRKIDINSFDNVQKFLNGIN